VAEDLGLVVADGFEVTRYAGDELCHDVFSMTIDSRGRVVVSGPGYVRILHDRNGDGVADDATEFVAGPRSGAQGLFFYGPDLLCTGDAGLLRYRDRDGDDRADGPPEVFLRARAGGEHDIHAVRQGPDGWWYVIAGNTAQIDQRYITLPTSPVKQPQAGTMIRFKPDLSAGEVVADGIRNAYDFDFSLSGDLFLFDSDGERDLSLPWYQPTRVFHTLPGSNLGWRSNSLIRPSDSLDMPPTLADLGRSSPTGVVCYRHTTFPAKYHGALFVLDWTFGRIWALPLEEHGATWKTQPIVFLQADGDHGFAPTDAEVGPDGALYVCIGGRGTRGGVYRVQARGAGTNPWTARTATPAEQLTACLRAPQPLASWSRAQWEPWAAQLGPQPFIAEAQSPSRPVLDRIRAVEILTEKFGGLPTAAAIQLAQDPEVMVRARVAWSLGRVAPADPALVALRPYLRDVQPQVARNALEALLGVKPEILDQLTTEIGQQLAHADPTVRLAALQVAARATPESFQRISAEAINRGWIGAVPVAAAFSQRQSGFQPYLIDLGTRLLRSTRQPIELRADAIRLLQLGLGEVGPAQEGLPPAYEAYSAQIDLQPYREQLIGMGELLNGTYPTGHARFDREAERLMAMLQLGHVELRNKVLSQITETSNPVDDFHRLLVLARLSVPPEQLETVRVARAIVMLESKMKRFGLPQDSSWDDRVMELLRAHVRLDPSLPEQMLTLPEFGSPGHVQFASLMPPKRFADVQQVFLNRIDQDSEYPWSNDLVFLMANSKDEAVRDLVREKFADYSLRTSVIMAFADNPQERDRRFFIDGLESAQLDVLLQCLQALSLLRPRADAYELVMLVRTLRRLNPQDKELQARDQVAELLQLNLRTDFGYRLAQRNNPQQAAVDRVTELVRDRFPEEYSRQVGESTEAAEKLQQLLAQTPWQAGDLEQGRQLFVQRACQQCHGGRKALGPDLLGVTGRFSKEDLFVAIAFPHRDVSPRYQTTQIAMKNGHVHTGLVVYEYPDALVLRDAQNRTYRLNTKDIEARQTLSRSLMPEGLLKDLGPQDLANLYAYLRSLNATRTASAAVE
jgi:putative membrane-bound dehydrogenase-like protein